MYSIPYRKCHAVYIGQIGRLLETRIREHKAAVKYAKCDVSAVADHVWNKHHEMDFPQVSILAQEQNQQQRCFLESWFIQTHTTINGEIGSLLPVYNCFVFLFVPYLSLLFCLSILSCMHSFVFSPPLVTLVFAFLGFHTLNSHCIPSCH